MLAVPPSKIGAPNGRPSKLDAQLDGRVVSANRINVLGRVAEATER